MKHYTRQEHKDAHTAEADVTAMIKVLGNQLLYHPAPEVLEDALEPEREKLDFSGCFYRDRNRQ